MTIYDLNEDQLAELKQRYYAEKTGRDLSYYELANIDELVSWSEIRDAYEHVDFVPDDFFCSAGEEEFDTCRVVIEGANRNDVAYALRDIAEKIESGYTNGILSDGTTWYIE